MSRGTIVEEIPGDELDEIRIVEAIVRGPGMSKAATIAARRGDAQVVPDGVRGTQPCDGAGMTAAIRAPTPRRRLGRGSSPARSPATPATRTSGARSSSSGCGCRWRCRCLLIVALLGYTESRFDGFINAGQHHHDPAAGDAARAGGDRPDARDPGRVPRSVGRGDDQLRRRRRLVPDRRRRLHVEILLGVGAVFLLRAGSRSGQRRARSAVSRSRRSSRRWPRSASSTGSR